jgi:soluble lytic murein transglycosylase
MNLRPRFKQNQISDYFIPFFRLNLTNEFQHNLAQTILIGENKVAAQNSLLQLKMRIDVISYILSIILIFTLNCCFCFDAIANNNSTENDKFYKQTFDYIKNKQWLEAKKLANKLNNRALLKIVLSQEFLDSNYQDTNFYKITNFLKKNPKWPQNNLLKIRAEKLINSDTDSMEIYNWFKIHPPITGYGYKHYALAAAQVLTDQDKFIPIIKKGWIHGGFDKEEQLKFYNKFKKFLTKSDHIKKIDNLIWTGSISAAKWLFILVEPEYQKSFSVQIALTTNNKDAKDLFKTVNKEYYTPGLIYQYINSQKKNSPKSIEIVNLLNSIKKHQIRGDDFWKIQSYLAREYIENKQFNDAYNISSNHFAVSSINISEAEFLSGWIALRYLNKTDLAIKHFTKFGQVVKTPMSLSRGLYWLGRAYMKNGQKEEAKKLYHQAANQFGYTFYGQVATIEIGSNTLKLPVKINPSQDEKNYHIKNNDIFEASNLISKYGTNALTKIYLENLVNSVDTEEQVLALALASNNFKVHHKVWLSRSAIQKHVFINHYAYPIPYKIAHLPTEPSLTYSIVRQESSFEQRVIAEDNGMGLMQLMEPTACDTAKKIAVKCNLKSLTNDPHYNLTLGSHYLAEMLKKYQNSYVLAIAAYNAGPHRVKKWLNLYGDLRKFKDYHDAIDWIESIPFPATRNYVQRVLENLQIYRVTLNKSSKFNLKKDLLRH